MHGLVSALLDPEIRSFVNSQRKASIELHYDSDSNSVAVTIRHASRYRLKLRGRVHVVVSPPR